MQMSDTTMSKICDDNRRLAASPFVAVSTRCPSLRKLISSSSQMERSSSTINRCAIRLGPPCRPQNFGMGARIRLRLRGNLRRSRQIHDEGGATPLFRFDAYLSPMRLQNLVHNRETEARAARESRLKGLENALGRSRVEAHPGIANRNSHRLG